MDDQTLQPAAAQPVTLRVARAAKVIGMPVTQAQCADVFHRLGFAFTEGEGTLTVTPPSWRFDLQIEEDLIEEVIRVIGYQQLPDTPPLAPVTRARAQRIAPQPACGAPRAGRARLPGDDQLQLRRGALGAASWPATPTRSACSTRSPPAGGDALQPGRQPARRAAATTWRARPAACACSRSAACSCAMPRCPTATRTVAGVDQPLRLAAWPMAPAARLQWGQQGARRRLLRRQGRRRGAARAAQAALRAGRPSGAAPGPLRRDRARRPRHRPCRRTASALAPGLRAAAGAAAVRARARRRAGARPLPVAQPVPRHQSAWRDIALVVRDDVTHDAWSAALAPTHRAGALGDCCSTSTARRSPAPTSAPANTAWRCAWNCSTTRPP